MSASQSLRIALLADAAASGATGLLMAAGAGLLAGLLGLPQALLATAGLLLVPFALFVGWLGMRPEPARAAVWAVVAINAIWVAGSILLLVPGALSPTALGYAFVIAQALVVLVLAAMQYSVLRRQAAHG